MPVSRPLSRQKKNFQAKVMPMSCYAILLQPGRFLLLNWLGALALLPKLPRCPTLIEHNKVTPVKKRPPRKLMKWSPWKRNVNGIFDGSFFFADMSLSVLRNECMNVSGNSPRPWILNVKLVLNHYKWHLHCSLYWNEFDFFQRLEA